MTRDPIACETDQSVMEVAELMREKCVGSVVVLQDGKVVGIVTDRQLACEGLTHGNPSQLIIADVMTPHPACVTLKDNVFSVIDTLRSAGVVRRVPVVNADHELLGIVSLSDIAVMAKDLLDAVMLEETHHSLREARIQTGAKDFVKHMRRPTKDGLLPPEREIKPVTVPTHLGTTGPGPSGPTGEPPEPGSDSIDRAL